MPEGERSPIGTGRIVSHIMTDKEKEEEKINEILDRRKLTTEDLLKLTSLKATQSQMERALELAQLKDTQVELSREINFYEKEIQMIKERGQYSNEVNEKLIANLRAEQDELKKTLELQKTNFEKFTDYGTDILRGGFATAQKKLEEYGGPNGPAAILILRKLALAQAVLELGKAAGTAFKSLDEFVEGPLRESQRVSRAAAIQARDFGEALSDSFRGPMTAQAMSLVNALKMTKEEAYAIVAASKALRPDLQLTSQEMVLLSTRAAQLMRSGLMSETTVRTIIQQTAQFGATATETADKMSMLLESTKGTRIATDEWTRSIVGLWRNLRDVGTTIEQVAGTMHYFTGVMHLSFEQSQRLTQSLFNLPTAMQPNYQAFFGQRMGLPGGPLAGMMGLQLLAPREASREILEQVFRIFGERPIGPTEAVTATRLERLGPALQFLTQGMGMSQEVAMGLLGLPRGRFERRGGEYVLTEEARRTGVRPGMDIDLLFDPAKATAEATKNIEDSAQAIVQALPYWEKIYKTLEAGFTWMRTTTPGLIASAIGAGGLAALAGRALFAGAGGIFGGAAGAGSQLALPGILSGAGAGLLSGLGTAGLWAGGVAAAGAAGLGIGELINMLIGGPGMFGNYKPLFGLLEKKQMGGPILKEGPYYLHAGEYVIPPGDSHVGTNLNVNMGGITIQVTGENLDEALDKHFTRVKEEIKTEWLRAQYAR
jgi:hypothetical protein